MAAVAWSLLALLTLEPRILPARAAVRDRPATTATAVVVRVWRRTPRRQPVSIVFFIVGADHRLVLVVIRALMIPEPRQDPRRANRVAPARTTRRVKGLA